MCLWVTVAFYPGSRGSGKESLISIACVCLFSIRSIELRTCPERGSGTILFRVSRSRGKAPDYVKLKASVTYTYKLNYALESHCLFTLSLH